MSVVAASVLPIWDEVGHQDRLGDFSILVNGTSRTIHRSLEDRSVTSPALVVCLSGFARLGNWVLTPGSFGIYQPRFGDMIEAQPGTRLLSVEGRSVPHCESTSNVMRLPYQDRPRGIRVRSLTGDTDLKNCLGCEWACIEPHGQIEEHYHPRSDSRFYVISGNGHATLAGDTLPLEPGFYGSIASGRWHSLVAGEDGLTLLALQTPPATTQEDYMFSHPR